MDSENEDVKKILEQAKKFKKTRNIEDEIINLENLDDILRENLEELFDILNEDVISFMSKMKKTASKIKITDHETNQIVTSQIIVCLLKEEKTESKHIIQKEFLNISEKLEEMEESSTIFISPITITENVLRQYTPGYLRATINEFTIQYLMGNEKKCMEIFHEFADQEGLSPSKSKKNILFGVKITLEDKEESPITWIDYNKDLQISSPMSWTSGEINFAKIEFHEQMQLHKEMENMKNIKNFDTIHVFMSEEYCYFDCEYENKIIGPIYIQTYLILDKEEEFMSMIADLCDVLINQNNLDEMPHRKSMS